MVIKTCILSATNKRPDYQDKICLQSGFSGIWLTHLGEIPAASGGAHIVEICPSASRSRSASPTAPSPKISTTESVEKFNDHTVEELESAGAGPKSVA